MSKAENVVKVTDIEEGALRLFTRVDSAVVSPHEIYDRAGVLVEDRAKFSIKPASPATKEKLREVQAGIDINTTSLEAEAQALLMQNGEMVEQAREVKALIDAGKEDELDPEEISDEYIRVGQKLEAVKKQTAIMERLAKSSNESREAIAECLTGVENYKVYDGEKKELIVLGGDALAVVMDMHELFCVWLYDEIEDRSKLTPSEYLGG